MNETNSKTKREIAVKSEVVEISKPKDMLDLALTIKKIIVERNLYTKIQGKNYVNVEGWQLAGALTGIYPRVEKVERQAGNGICYRAEVSLFKLSDGSNMGNGVAICSNTEPGKRNFAEYAVASMAQTRAIGKAYRLTLGWLLKIAGYEATPVEEMPPTPQQAVAPAPNENDRQALAACLTVLDKSGAEIEQIQRQITTEAMMRVALAKARRMVEEQAVAESQEVPETEPVIDANAI